MKKYKLESMRPYKFSGKMIRIWKWIKSPWGCKLSYHILDYENCGFTPGSNQLDVRCKACGNYLGIPIDDLDEEGRKNFRFFVKLLEEERLNET